MADYCEIPSRSELGTLDPLLSPAERKVDYLEGDSLWLYLPHFLIRLGGIAVGFTLVLASIKGDVSHDLPWWVVLLPITVALGILFLVFTVVLLVWVHVCYQVGSGNIEVDCDREVRLDVLLRTAKICFLGHGYIVLLIISLSLLLLKLEHWPNLPAVYPLLPIIVIGVVYMFLAVMLKQPEVDAPWFFIAGSSLFSQSVMLLIKLDYFHESKRLPWAAAFVPSWLTYVLLLIYCVLAPVQAWRATRDDNDNTDTSYGAAGHVRPRRPSSDFQDQLLKSAGIACWAIGWGVSQVLLALQLDAIYKGSWLCVVLPALLGWILLLVCVTKPLSEYFKDIVRLVLDTFGLVPLGDGLCKEVMSPRVPWR